MKHHPKLSPEPQSVVLMAPKHNMPAFNIPPFPLEEHVYSVAVDQRSFLFVSDSSRIHLSPANVLFKVTFARTNPAGSRENANTRFHSKFNYTPVWNGRNKLMRCFEES